MTQKAQLLTATFVCLMTDSQERTALAKPHSRYCKYVLPIVYVCSYALNTTTNLLI